MMDIVNSEIKKVVSKVKDAIQNQGWIDDARHYAERQGKEVKKLFSADLDRVKDFLEREKVELSRLQKQLPGEVRKIKKFVISQRKELEKLVARVRKASASGPASVRSSRTASASKAKKKTSSKSKS